MCGGARVARRDEGLWVGGCAGGTRQRAHDLSPSSMVATQVQVKLRGATSAPHSNKRPVGHHPTIHTALVEAIAL